MPFMSPKQFYELPFFVYSLLGFREALPSMPESHKESECTRKQNIKRICGLARSSLGQQVNSLFSYWAASSRSEEQAKSGGVAKETMHSLGKCQEATWSLGGLKLSRKCFE